MGSSAHKVITEERAPVMKICDRRGLLWIFVGLTLVVSINAIYYITNIILDRDQSPKHVLGKDSSNHSVSWKQPHPATNPGIMFVQTSDERNPSELAMCAIESAAKMNPDQIVYYFMKGFNGNFSAHREPKHKDILTLSSIKNVVIMPLNLEELFKNTRLAGWYKKVDYTKEMYWIHVLSDACRIALLWKYGGVYLDTDIISLKPLELHNFSFICAQSKNYANGAALGLNHNHPFANMCITDYVESYSGEIWGHQGPDLITRMLKKWCNTDDLDMFLNKDCKGIFYLSSNWFYPVPYTDWEKYFEKGRWDKDSYAIQNEFSKTSGVHIWNFLSHSRKDPIKGSRSLLDYFFSNYCPMTYTLL